LSGSTRGGSGFRRRLGGGARVPCERRPADLGRVPEPIGAVRAARLRRVGTPYRGWVGLGRITRFRKPGLIRPIPHLTNYALRLLAEVQEHWPAVSIGGVTMLSAAVLMMDTAHLFRGSPNRSGAWQGR
jgi:hypothetical protein